MIRRETGPPDTYQLLFAGGGRRLERFGRFVLDRPCAACSDVAGTPTAVVDARFSAEAPIGHGWSGDRQPSETWTVTLNGLTFQLGLTETGQVGLFPEQLQSWRWIQERIRERAGSDDQPTMLNLFAYTGGSTLAAAQAGAAVVHVDASKASVSWARRNAGLSDLAEAPIRWIVDDAQAFVRRELRRGSLYDGVVLDPPTYGHGAKGQPWRLGHDLPELLAGCAALVKDRSGFLLLTSHATGLGTDRLAGLLVEAVEGTDRQPDVESGDLGIEPSDGDILRLGSFARLAR